MYHNIPALASPASIPRTAALVVKFDEVLRDDDDDDDDMMLGVDRNKNEQALVVD